jgi:hypothetical protein
MTHANPKHLRLTRHIAYSVLFTSCIGCTRPLQDLTPTLPPKSAAPATSGSVALPTGSIAGRVIWTGGIPDPLPISGLISNGDGPPRWGQMPNHLAPKLDPKTKGMANAVVYLKQCDSKLAKPWPYAPLRIEQRDRKFSVKQGARIGRTGFVRVGEPFDMVSLDGDYQMLRARGAGFFTLPFPEANRPLTRTIDTAGRTELTSAAGYFWSSADVFSCEHPYYTTTDDAGRFTLDGVPPGSYSVVAWHRNWKLEHFERDPETGKIMRLLFAKPFRTEREVKVEAGRVEVDLSLSSR